MCLSDGAELYDPMRIRGLLEKFLVEMLMITGEMLKFRGNAEVLEGMLKFRGNAEVLEGMLKF